MYVWVRSFFLFKQKTAYEMRISDWSSDVCSSDLLHLQRRTALGDLDPGTGLDGGGPDRGVGGQQERPLAVGEEDEGRADRRLTCLVEAAHEEQIGRASCRERVCQYV